MASGMTQLGLGDHLRVLSKLRFRGKHLPMYSKRIVARVVDGGKKWAYFEHTLEVGQ